MLGVGFTQSDGLSKNLVQIGTGEGKSVTLAITAAALAIFGMDTFCVCYSDYLSKRDYNAFEALFAKLEILERVNYGTFNKICETVLNKNGDVRGRIQEFIMTNELGDMVEVNGGHSNKKILLIDEVDVFFSKDFYGNRYNPSLNLVDGTLVNLLTMIWRDRADELTLDTVKETQEFAACVDRFSADWEMLIVEAVKDMLYELKTFETGK